MCNRLIATLALPFLLLPACSGGGSGTAAPPAGAGPGSVQVVFDTTAGSEAFVQAQVVAAALRSADGSLTPDLLHGPTLFTIADPTAEPSSLLLRSVPDGDYTELHLVLAPGSGVCLQADGSRVPVDLPVPDLAIALSAIVHHDHTRVTWLQAGHDGVMQLSVSGGRGQWTPRLRGGPAGGADLQASVDVVAVQQDGVVCHLGGGALHIAFLGTAELRGADDQPVPELAAFLAGMRPGDDLRVQGTLDDSGGLRAHGGTHRRRDDGPHLIGRIVELLPAEQSFRMLVLFEQRAGGRFLPAATWQLLVRAAGTRLHQHHALLAFTALRTDDLVKVEGTLVAGELRAREVELEHHAGQMRLPEVEGALAAVDLQGRTLLLVPRGNDPLIVGGTPVSQLRVLLTGQTVLVRQANSGGDRTVIRLEDVLPGRDRAWVHGTLVEPGVMAARLVRVRDDTR